MSINFELKTSTKLKIARFFYLILKFIGFNRIQICKRLGIQFHLELNEAIDCSLYVTGTYENDLIQASKKLIREDMVIFDIGANCGVHTLWMASLLKGKGRVFAFEATEYAFHRLIKNINLNLPLKKIITPIHIFLKASEADDKENYVSSSWDISRTIEDPKRHALNGGFDHQVSSVQMTLDRWVLENQITKLDLIKLDVDGNETTILQGAQKTIEKYRPLIFMELSPIHFEDRMDSFRDQIELITKHHYEFFDMNNKKLPQDVSALEKLIPRGVLINILCRPL